MSALPQQRMTVAEYLAFERQGDIRYEYFHGEIFAMVGASENHILIAGSTHSSLYLQLRGRDCRVYQTDMKVRINRQIYTYPDLVAVCGERKFEDEARTILLNPTVIFEILSPSTEQYDRKDKFHHYRSLPSVREYVMITQNMPHLDHYVRQPDNKWLLTDVDGLDASLELVSINCVLKLSDVYEQVSFDPDQS